MQVDARMTWLPRIRPRQTNHFPRARGLMSPHPPTPCSPTWHGGVAAGVVQWDRDGTVMEFRGGVEWPERTPAFRATTDEEERHGRAHHRRRDGAGGRRDGDGRVVCLQSSREVGEGSGAANELMSEASLRMLEANALVREQIEREAYEKRTGQPYARVPQLVDMRGLKLAW